MKFINTKNLRVGDWVIWGNKKRKIEGKIKIARVGRFIITFNDYEELDLINGKIEIIGRGELEEIDGVMEVLNKKEIRALDILRTKLKTLNNLEDKPIKKKW